MTPTCGYELEGETCDQEGYFAFLPSDLVLCEEHCRATYTRYEQVNQQLVWYLQLRERFSDN